MGCGVPIEDARAILPTDIMTSMFVGYQLSTFANVYAQRVCCQAQDGTWKEIMKKMRDILVEQYSSDFKTLISAPFERGEPCGYRASFDRPCTWQKEKK
jgi:thymidylate synthase ThyX